MSVIELVKNGGWIMWPLVLLSIVAWIVCVERFLTFRRWKEKNEQFALSFQNFWLKNDHVALRKLTENSDADLAMIAKEALSALETRALSTQAKNRMERRRLEQSAELRKNLWILGTIGSATPFLGLFGTVVGIIKAFESIASTGSGGFTVVAAGISEALIATAGGIIVAVIAVFFYNFYQVKVSKLQFTLRMYTEELAELLENASA